MAVTGFRIYGSIVYEMRFETEEIVELPLAYYFL